MHQSLEDQWEETKKSLLIFSRFDQLRLTEFFIKPTLEVCGDFSNKTPITGDPTRTSYIEIDIIVDLLI